MKEKKCLRSVLGVCLLAAFALLPFSVLAQSTQPAPGHEKVSINLLGGPFGVSSYVAAFSLADLINKKSSWLQVRAIETKGAAENIKTLIVDPKKRKTHILISTDSTNYLATMGLPPYDEKYTNLRAIATYGCFAPTFITLDPSIEATGKDFMGKKIGLSFALGDDTVVARAIFEAGFGIPFKKFQIEYLGWEGVLDALADGMLDIAYIGVLKLRGGKFVATPALQKFMASVRKPIHWISFPPDLINKTRQGSGLPTFSVHVKEGALGPKQTEAYDGFTGTVGWWADTEMDNDVTYEIARIIYEYHQEMWPAHILLTYVSPETMGQIAPTEKDLHPGALKLYKERGIKIGID